MTTRNLGSGADFLSEIAELYGSAMLYKLNLLCCALRHTHHETACSRPSYRTVMVFFPTSRDPAFRRWSVDIETVQPTPTKDAGSKELGRSRWPTRGERRRDCCRVSPLAETHRQLLNRVVCYRPVRLRKRCARGGDPSATP